MKRALIWFLLPASIIYVLFSIIYPTDPSTIAERGLSTGEARIIALSVSIPLIAVWCIAFVGAWRFKDFARSISKHQDGAGLFKLATGIQLLAIYLPLRSLSKIILNYFAFHNPAYTTATNVIISYINIIIPLIVYLLIGNASYELYKLADARMALHIRYLLIGVFSVIAVTFCYATCAHDSLTPSDWLVVTDFSIPDPFRLLTVLVPYLFMWAVGMLAAADIYVFQRTVKGIFYRQSLKLLSVGLMIEILASVATQYVTSIASTLTSLPTGVVMFIAYAVLICTGLGFILIYQGVNRIKRLEEV